MHSLEKDVIDEIRCTEVISSFRVAFQEIVYNAIDSGASQIDCFINPAQWSFSVSDNGKGIAAEDFPKIGQSYMTSKLSNIETLHSVTTHGFRGEALASLARCASLEVVSCTSPLRPTHKKILYRGQLQAFNECPPQRNKTGTTIKVSDLFWCYPVRRASAKPSSEIVKETKQAFEKIVLAHHQISFTLFDSSTATVLFDLSSQQELLGRFSQLFGTNLAISLRKVISEDALNKFHFELYLPQPNAKKMPTKELQFCYINKRYFPTSPFSAVINKIYKSLYLLDDRRKRKYPYFVVMLFCEPTLYDVTFHPEKNIIEFSDWKSPMELVRQATNNYLYGDDSLKMYRSSQTRHTMIQGNACIINTINDQKQCCSDMSCDKKDFSLAQTKINNAAPSDKIISQEHQQLSLDKSGYGYEFPELQEVSMNVGKKRKRTHKTLFDEHQSDPESEDRYQKQTAHTGKNEQQPVMSNLDLYMNPRKLQRMRLSPADFKPTKKLKVSPELTQNLSRWKASVLSPKRGFTDTTFPSLIQFSTTKFPSRHEYPIHPNDLKVAEVIGQFDCKFITVKINDVIYLFDQHAVHERIRLEEFENETYGVNGNEAHVDICTVNEVHSVTTQEQHRLVEFADVIRKWGFSVMHTSTAQHSVVLTSVPALGPKRMNFDDLRDFVADLALHRDVAVRPRAAQRILASRSCRGAITFGDRLDHRACTSLIRRLVDCRIPFQCAHGRPNVYPLFSLKHLTGNDV